MTQDCSSSQTFDQNLKLLNGLQIVEPQDDESPIIDEPEPDQDSNAPTSWGYVYIANGRVEKFLQQLELIKAHGDDVPVAFVHRSPRSKKEVIPDYQPKSAASRKLTAAAELSKESSTVEETTEEYATEPAEELATEPAEELATEPTEELATEPAEELAEELATEPAEELATEPADEPINEFATEQSAQDPDSPENDNQEKPQKPLPLTVSGLVFLQGDTKTLQTFLSAHFLNVNLGIDCATKRPAVIPHSQMKTFIELMNTAPERVTFLRESFEHFAKNHVLLRIKTGNLAGKIGYIVRINRDRQLVMQIGNLVVSISGVHNETFEKVRTDPIQRKPMKSSKKRPSQKKTKAPKRPMPTKEVGKPKQKKTHIRHRKKNA